MIILQLEVRVNTNKYDVQIFLMKAFMKIIKSSLDFENYSGIIQS